MNSPATARNLFEWAKGSARPAFNKPANDNRMPAGKLLALWAMPAGVLALAAAIVWQLI